MEQKRANRHLIAILGFGILACGIAFGFRMLHGKDLSGVWKGIAYKKDGGKYIPDEAIGDFVIVLDAGGKYSENGNETSGTWTQNGNKLTLVPTTFHGLTADENRQRYRKKDGSASKTMESLLKNRMQTMVIEYQPEKDHLIFDEPTLRYEYARI